MFPKSRACHTTALHSNVMNVWIAITISELVPGFGWKVCSCLFLEALEFWVTWWQFIFLDAVLEIEALIFFLAGKINLHSDCILIISFLTYNLNILTAVSLVCIFYHTLLWIYYVLNHVLHKYMNINRMLLLCLLIVLHLHCWPWTSITE